MTEETVADAVVENALTVGGYETNALAIGGPMAGAVVGLSTAVRETAEQQLEAFEEEQGETFTATEREALIVVQELANIMLVDLATLLMKAQRVKKIQRENLVTRHPGDYASLAELAQDNGMSNSELSNILDLVDTIFPYLANAGFSIGALWQSMGKSKFREMTPALKVLITGEPSAHATVNASVDLMLENVVATALANGGEELTTEEQHEMAVQWLVEETEQLTIPQMRRQTRPTTTPVIQGSNVNIIPPAEREEDAFHMVMMKCTPEQYLLLQRKMGAFMELQIVNLPEEQVLRRDRAAQIPELRTMLAEMGV